MFYGIVLTAAAILWHIGFRITVVGRENLPKQGSFVLVPNHISAIDPVFVVVARFWGKRMVVMAKEEIFANGFLRWFFTQVGCISVARGKGDTDMLEEVTRQCKEEGRGLLVFAEGTRSKDGWPGKIKSGAFVVASAVGAPMVPCRIIYCTRDGRAHLFCRVLVCFGQPIPAQQLDLGEKRSAAKLRQNKQLLDSAWRELYQCNKMTWMPDQPIPEKKALRSRAQEETEE